MAAYRAWLMPTWLREVTDERVRVGTTNAFSADWILKNYGARLESLLEEELGRKVRVEIVEENSRPQLP